MGWERSLVVFLQCFVVFVGSLRVPDECGYIPDYSKDFLALPALKHPDDLSLKLVQVVIRHGDRTPWSPNTCWPNDAAKWNCQLTSLSVPSNSTDSNLSVPRLYRQVHFNTKEVLGGNCLVGQLTTRGYSQEMHNGDIFRDSYIKNTPFLSPKFNSTETFIRSDNEDRTIQSAQSLLLGLYPPTNGQSTEIIDIHTRDTFLDDIEENCNICPRLCQIQKEAYYSKGWSDHFAQVTIPLAKKLSAVLGFNVSITGFPVLMDCFISHICHSFPIPNGAEALYQQVVNETVWEYQYQYSYPNVTYRTQRGIGFLISDIYQEMQASIAGKSQRKFKLYSGHDTTLFPLLVALNSFDGQWPHYASYMAFELYQANNSSNYFIRVIYNGKELTVPNCSSPICDYNLFSKYVSQIIPNDNSCAAQ